MGRYITPTWQEFDSNGDPLAGAKLFFYTSGGLVEKDTFSDDALSAANANPVVADAAGRFGNIYLESGTYRIILKDSSDGVIWDRDPVDGAASTSGVVDEISTAYTVTVGDGAKLLNVDATSGAITVTLLAAATAGDGFEITIKKSDASANAVTVDGNGAETIDGAATQVISEQYGTVSLRSDGAAWVMTNSPLAAATQVIAEAGTSTTLLSWSAALIKQAIDALAHETGDISFGYQTSKAGWVFLDGGTVGNASSGGTTRANADTEDLFTLLWTNLADAEAPVSTGRGGSAAADFAANKTITPPDHRGRVIAGQDDMGGSSANRIVTGFNGDTLGLAGGAETHTLTEAEMPAHTHPHTGPNSAQAADSGSNVGGQPQAQTTSSTGGGGAHNNLQPTIIANVFIKL